MLYPIITSAPHEGDSFAEFSDRCALTDWQIGEFSDKYTAKTAFFENALGNLHSKVSRGLGSLNQPRDYSLFRTEDFLGNQIWKNGKELTQEEKEYCFKKYYDPYYKELKRFINEEAPKNGFKEIILWDHHDTGDFNPKTNKRDRNMPGEQRPMPKFILSNFGMPNTGKVDPKNGYTTCPEDFIKQVQKLISEEFNLERSEVEINTSYKGGNIIQHHGNPDYPSDTEIYAIQIEYNRGFIMDQGKRQPYWDTIKEFNKKFNEVMKKACGII